MPMTPQQAPRRAKTGKGPRPKHVPQRMCVVCREKGGKRTLTRIVLFWSLFTALTGRRRPRWCAEGTAPLLISSVRVCEPVDGVAEVVAVARRAGRAHAVAARLEGIDGRWRCTALQIG